MPCVFLFFRAFEKILMDFVLEYQGNIEQPSLWGVICSDIFAHSSEVFAKVCLFLPLKLLTTLEFPQDRDSAASKSKGR